LDGFDTPIAREGDDETIDDYTRVCIFMYTKDMKVSSCTTRRKCYKGRTRLQIRKESNEIGMEGRLGDIFPLYNMI
jgi:hypothetical protein